MAALPIGFGSRAGLPITRATDVGFRSSTLAPSRSPCPFGARRVLLVTGVFSLEVASFEEFYQWRVLRCLGSDLAGLAGPEEELLATG